MRVLNSTGQKSINSSGETIQTNFHTTCPTCCCYFPSSVTATFSDIVKCCFGPFGLGYYSIDDSVFGPVALPETATCSGGFNYHPVTSFDHFDNTTPCTDFLNLEVGDTEYWVILQGDPATGIVHIKEVTATSTLGAAASGYWFSFTASGAIATWPVFGDSIPNQLTSCGAGTTGYDGSVVIS